MKFGSLELFLLCLAVLLLLSAFFSASETGMMAINRYRLRHLLRKKYLPAVRVNQLLKRPDRLLGAILIGNTVANILASVVTTLIAVRLFGDVGVAIATVVLTLAIMIFVEVMPKTLAAVYPERTAFLASWPLTWLLKIIYPAVWLINSFSNGLLRIFGVRITSRRIDTLSQEELRTLVYETTGSFGRYRKMLLSILDLEKVNVEDIMVPRNDVIGIDLDHDWDDILQLLTQTQHTRLPIYRGSIDQVQGMLHLRRALNLLANQTLNKNSLMMVADPMYFVPKGTSLNQQLLNFQREKCRSGLVVDEYGDIQGLVTLEDILEEIVGEFTTSLQPANKGITPQEDGSYFIDGSITIRELNRLLGVHFSTEGPKTLNGLITEHLETLPEAGICLRIDGYPLEIIAVEENLVKTARIWLQRLVVSDNLVQ